MGRTARALGPVLIFVVAVPLLIAGVLVVAPLVSVAASEPAPATATPSTTSPPAPAVPDRLDPPEPEPEPKPEPRPEPEPVAEPRLDAAPDPDPDDGTLRPGEENPAVLALQQRLVELGYWLGEPDGHYGRLTEQAVLAFQKAEGLGRDGIAGPATHAALATVSRPEARSAEDGIEIDLTRQLLLVVRDGGAVWAINTSTGTSATPTPVGEFEIERAIDGLRHAELGTLYRPRYFHEGVAIHGSPSIPGHAASHGCARVSNSAMDMLWAAGLAPIGSAVRVYQ